MNAIVPEKPIYGVLVESQLLRVSRMPVARHVDAATDTA